MYTKVIIYNVAIDIVMCIAIVFSSILLYFQNSVSSIYLNAVIYTDCPLIRKKMYEFLSFMIIYTFYTMFIFFLSVFTSVY